MVVSYDGGDSAVESSTKPSSRRRAAMGAADDMRCPHCAGPLGKNMETSQWTVPPLIRDSFSMIGSAVGETTSAFYGFNHVMPFVQKRITGPIWLHFLVGVSASASGPTSDCFLLCLCWASRWCCASTCSACIFILSCCSCIITFGFFTITG